jgi:hypothetical protein
MECFLEKKNIETCNLQTAFKFKSHSKKNSILNNLFDNKKVLTCKKCDVFFVDDVSTKYLNNFYTEFYKKVETLNCDNILLKNKFHQFNARFFSQTLYFLRFFNITPNTKILEIGPNNQGILPTLKLFQSQIKYYYFEQNKSKIISKYGGKYLGRYFTPKKKIPKIDIIWMSHSMEHLNPNELKSTFKKLKNNLATNGKIFIEVPNELKYNYFHSPHTFYFNRKFFELFFSNLGFNLVQYNEINLATHASKNKVYKKRLKFETLRHIINFLPSFMIKIPFIFIKLLSFQRLINQGNMYLKSDIIRIIIQKK